MTCKNCQDTGRNPGSEYLDCTRCDAAEQHAELGRFLVSHYADPACAWEVHQRAYSMGVAAAEARAVSSQRYSLVETQHGSGYMIYWEKDLEADPEGEWIKFSDLAAIAAPKVTP